MAPFRLAKPVKFRFYKSTRESEIGYVIPQGDTLMYWALLRGRGTETNRMWSLHPRETEAVMAGRHTGASGQSGADTLGRALCSAHTPSVTVTATGLEALWGLRMPRGVNQSCRTNTVFSKMSSNGNTTNRLNARLQGIGSTVNGGSPASAFGAAEPTDGSAIGSS